ncbi:hypothetical protein L6R52_02230 [Myxococcota bacterium]|nr:hypothetical protein [Myxococcota bacterium]
MATVLPHHLRSRAPALLAVLAVALFVALPSDAWACPNCAQAVKSPGRTFLLLVMIVLPWTVVLTTYFFIRRISRSDAEPTT